MSVKAFSYAKDAVSGFGVHGDCTDEGNISEMTCARHMLYADIFSIS